MVNRVQFYGQGPLQAMRQEARTNPRLQLAQAMMQQGASTAPVQSWQEGLARMLQSGVGGYFAGKEQEKLDKREKAYNEAMKQALMGATQGVQQPMPQGVQGPPQMVSGPAGFAQAAQASGNADIMPMALQMQMQADAEEQALNRQDELYRQQMADKERLMRLGSTLKPKPKPSDFDLWSAANPGKTYNDFMTAKTDNAVRVAQAQANIMSPLERAKLGKIEAEEEKKETSKSDMSSTLSSMANKYIKLNDLGGVVDPRKGWLENLGASVSSSGFGQAVGGAVGTEEASIRKGIMNMRPTLINMVRQATGMSAKGMDSNQELKFFLQTATDPSGDILSNLAAIDALDKTYGKGDVLKGLPENLRQAVEAQSGAIIESNVLPGMVGANVGQGGGLSPAEQQELEALRKRFGR